MQYTGSGRVGETGRDRHGFKDIFWLYCRGHIRRRQERKQEVGRQPIKEMNCLMMMWEEKLKSKEYKPSVNLPLKVSFSNTIRKKQYRSH